MGPEHGSFATHGAQVAHDVRPVGVAGGESERPPFTTATDQHRHVALQRARVTHGLGYLNAAAFVRRAAGAPKHRQQLQCIFQERIALSGRRELPAVGHMLIAIPGQAQAAHGATTAQYVQSGDYLAKMGQVPVRDAR